MFIAAVATAVFPNRLAAPATSAAYQQWASNITYPGWAYGSRLTTDLVLAAPAKAALGGSRQ